MLNPLEPHEPEEVLGRTIDKLDDLIYRARAFERGTSLRVVAPNEVGCPTADVEVDVDMESYDDATYLWGAYVSVRHPTDGVREGYHAFVEWGELTSEREVDLRPDVFKLVVEKGWIMLELHRDAQTLEDVFRHLTIGEERRNRQVKAKSAQNDQADDDDDDAEGEG